MENIDRSWQKLAQELEAGDHIGREEIIRDLGMESRLPIQKLLSNVKFKLYLTLAFIILFVFLAFWLRPLPVRLFMVGIAICYLLSGYFTYLGYRRIKEDNNLDLPSLEAIRLTKEAVMKLMKYELVFYVITFPIALTGGFLAGLSAESGNIDLLFEKNYVIWVLLACHILLFPLGYYFTKWANQKQLGNYLKQLDDILHAAEVQEK